MILVSDRNLTMTIIGDDLTLICRFIIKFVPTGICLKSAHYFLDALSVNEIST